MHTYNYDEYKNAIDELSSLLPDDITISHHLESGIERDCYLCYPEDHFLGNIYFCTKTFSTKLLAECKAGQLLLPHQRFIKYKSRTFELAGSQLEISYLPLLWAEHDDRFNKAKIWTSAARNIFEANKATQFLIKLKLQPEQSEYLTQYPPKDDALLAILRALNATLVRYWIDTPSKALLITNY